LGSLKLIHNLFKVRRFSIPLELHQLPAIDRTMVPAYPKRSIDLINAELRDLPKTVITSTRIWLRLP